MTNLTIFALFFLLLGGSGLWGQDEVETRTPAEIRRAKVEAQRIRRAAEVEAQRIKYAAQVEAQRTVTAAQVEAQRTETARQVEAQRTETAVQVNLQRTQTAAAVQAQRAGYFRNYNAYNYGWGGGFGWGGGYGYGGMFFVSGIKFHLELVPEADRPLVKRGIVTVNGAEIGIVNRHDGFWQGPALADPGRNDVKVELEDGRVFSTLIAPRPGQSIHVYVRFPPKGTTSMPRVEAAPASAISKH